MFVGLIQPLGCIWPLSDLQSQLIAKYLKGKWKLPADLEKAIKHQKENKTSILLASHNMSEVEKLCDSIIMMKNGKIVDRGTCKEII